MNFTTPNSAGFAEVDLAEVGWTDAARVASALARRARSLGRRAAKLATRNTRKDVVNFWPSSKRAQPYRTFKNGKMVRWHGVPHTFGRVAESALREFNRCHSPRTGQFCAGKAVGLVARRRTMHKRAGNVMKRLDTQMRNVGGSVTRALSVRKRMDVAGPLSRARYKDLLTYTSTR